jgi:hypothetical protein
MRASVGWTTAALVVVPIQIDGRSRIEFGSRPKVLFELPRNQTIARVAAVRKLFLGPAETLRRDGAVQAQSDESLFLAPRR